MPAPLVPIAIAVARALAVAAARQGVKQVSKSQAKRITAQVVSKTTGRKTVSSVEARRLAEQVAGPKAKSPTGRVPSKVMGPKTGPVIRKSGNKTVVSTPKNRGGKTKTNSPVTKSYQTNRVTPADRVAARQQERNIRVRELLTPIKPRGTRSGGKAILGPRPNPRTILVAKPGKATDANKLITAPRGRMGKTWDPAKQTESRRIAMRNAADRSKNSAQRDKELLPDRNQVGAPRAKDPAQREADKRVAEGLKKANQGKKARPEMPKTKPRAPKYPKSTTARFRRQTGGE